MKGSAAAAGARSDATATHPQARSILQRLLCLKPAAMLGRNTVVSCCTFPDGLVLIWLLVEELGWAGVSAALDLRRLWQ